MAIFAETSPWCAVGSADKDHRWIVEGRKKKPRWLSLRGFFYSQAKLPAYHSLCPMIPGCIILFVIMFLKIFLFGVFVQPAHQEDYAVVVGHMVVVLEVAVALFSSHRTVV